MTRLITKIGLLLIVALALCTELPVSASSGNRKQDAAWSFHSTFYNRPRRIIETPTHVYFFVFPHTYSSNGLNGYYKNVSGTIFRLDKSNPEAGLADMARSVHFSGFDMRSVKIDDATGNMAVAYMDGGIDIISPDGSVRYISVLKDSRNYRHASILGMRFMNGGNELWVSTGGGPAVFDTRTLAVRKLASWSEGLWDLVPVGDSYFAIIDKVIYSAPAGSDITDRGSFTKVANVTTQNPIRLLPIDGTYCGFSGENGYIHLMTLGTNGKWSRRQLVGDGKAPLAVGMAVTDRMEHNIYPVGSGYVVFSDTKVYLIEKEEGKAPSVRSVANPGGAGSYGSTIDGRNYWFFRSPSEFYSVTLKDDNTWSDQVASFRPAAPHTSMDVAFHYSSTQGFLVTNLSNGNKAWAYDALMPLTVAAYKDGQWTDLSPRREIPYFAAEDPGMLAQYNANAYYPLCDPYGIIVDPVFPDVVVGGALWHSVAASYLDDPRLKPLVYVPKNDGYASALGAVEVFPNSYWGGYMGTYVMGVDADNTIWATRSNNLPADGSSNSVAQLWAWTVDERRKAIESGNAADGAGWKKVEIETGLYPEFYVSGKALSHPKNRNKLLLSSQGSNGICRPLRIYDHKGTLDDCSDDTVTEISYFQNDNGRMMSSEFVNCIYEDPRTGEIYVGMPGDLYIVDLAQPVENSTIKVRSLSLASGGEGMHSLFSPLNVYAICDDEYGRLWFATSNMGVFGISADRKSLVAHFTDENSPLPNNAVYAVGWNPETKSLFMSTYDIVAEVKVDALADVSATDENKQPEVMPEVVMPDYAGTVAVHNVPRGTALVVRDADMKNIVTLPVGNDGTAHWNLLDADGNRVPSGPYTICDGTGTRSFRPLEIQVMR